MYRALMFTIFALATCGILWFLFKVNIEKGLHAFACIYAQNTKHLLLIVHPIVLYWIKLYWIDMTIMWASLSQELPRAKLRKGFQCCSAACWSCELATLRQLTAACWLAYPSVPPLRGRPGMFAGYPSPTKPPNFSFEYWTLYCIHIHIHEGTLWC